MNSKKKARKLRRIALAHTVGMPHEAYFNTVDVKAVPAMSNELTPGGKPRPRAVSIVRAQVNLMRTSTKGQYRALKKMIKGD